MLSSEFQADIILSDDSLVRAAVPSGASTGERLFFYSTFLFYFSYF